MVQAGEDQRYILRRLTRFASEDIGLAAPEAVGKAIAAWHSLNGWAHQKAIWRLLNW